MSKSTKNQSRRKFLDKGIMAGAGLGALGLAAMQLSKDKDTAEDEVVKMITLDGTVVEVNKKHINKMCAGRVSNATLKKWMDHEQNKLG